MTSIAGKILPRRHRPPMPLVAQRRVIDVLADVVLVQADRTVSGEPDVLRIDEIELEVGVLGVLDIHMPEPAGALMRQLQSHRIAKALPRTDPDPSVLGDPASARRARRPEQAASLATSVRQATAQVELGKPALYGVRQEQIDHRRAMVDTPDTAMVIDFDTQTVAARESTRICCKRLMKHAWIVTDGPQFVQTADASRNLPDVRQRPRFARNLESQGAIDLGKRCEGFETARSAAICR